jgi:hypothetical protein
VINRATADFWRRHDALPKAVRAVAKKNFRLFGQDPQHPSLEFKQLYPGLFSVRVGIHYRALARPISNGFSWFWIGSHSEYDRVIRGR